MKSSIHDWTQIRKQHKKVQKVQIRRYSNKVGKISSVKMKLYVN
jgi:hypothetical protein